MATLPPEPFRYAGVWNVETTYNIGDMVVSPIDEIAYVNGEGLVTGGSDPSIQPSATWVIAPESVGGGVNQLVAGTNVTLTPSSGLGIVTIDATAGAGGVSQIVAGSYVSVDPTSGLGTVTVNSLVQPSISGNGGSVEIDIRGIVTTTTPFEPFVIQNKTNAPTAPLTLKAVATENILIELGTGILSINSEGTGQVGLNLNGSSGTAGQIVSADGGGFVQWSDLPPAGVTSLTAGANMSVDPTTGGVTVALVEDIVTASGQFTNTVSATTITNIPLNRLNITADDDIPIVLTTSQTGDITLAVEDGRIGINELGTGKVSLNLGSSVGTAGQLVGSSGDGYLQWNDPLVKSVVAGTNITDVTELDGAWTVNAATQVSPVTSVVAGTNITSVVDVAGAWTVNAATQTYTPFVDSLQLYVAPNGNDTTGTGSQQNPFLTIAKAITQRATLSTAVEVSIVLSSGTYTENPTILANTYLVGITTGEARQPCNIIGNITMSGSIGSLGLSGLEINGTVTMNGALSAATHTIFGCNISGGATTAVTATTGTVFITESRISNTTGSTLLSQTTITIRDCVISTTGTGSCVFSSGVTTLRQCIISSSSASLTPLALVRMGNTTAKTLEVSLCRLEYTSGAGDITSVDKCCIAFNGSAAGTTTASIYNNLLICEGATTGTPLNQCIQKAAAAGAVTLSYGQLIAGATAKNIAPAISKTAYSVVV